MKRRFPIVVLLAALLLAIPAAAQPEDEALAIVSAALEGLQATTGYHFVSQQATVQTLTIPGPDGAEPTTVSSLWEQTIEGDVAAAAEGYAISARIDQRNTNDMTTTELTIEMVAVDGEVYVRFSNVGDLMQGMVEPDVWLSSTDLEETPEPGLSAANGLIQQVEQGALFPLSEDTIANVEEGEAQLLDDLPQRVFMVTLDSAALLDDGAFEPLTDSMGASADSESVEALLEGALVTMLISVGEEDNLPRRIETMLTLEGPLIIGQSTVDLSLNTTTITTFSGFNDPVSITIPETTP